MLSESAGAWRGEAARSTTVVVECWLAHVIEPGGQLAVGLAGFLCYVDSRTCSMERDRGLEGSRETHGPR